MLDSELLIISQDGDSKKVLGSKKEEHDGEGDDEVLEGQGQAVPEY